jgi:hypothetical protein
MMLDEQLVERVSTALGLDGDVGVTDLLTIFVASLYAAQQNSDEELETYEAAIARVQDRLPEEFARAWPVACARLARALMDAIAPRLELTSDLVSAAERALREPPEPAGDLGDDDVWESELTRKAERLTAATVLQAARVQRKTAWLAAPVTGIRQERALRLPRSRARAHRPRARSGTRCRGRTARTSDRSSDPPPPPDARREGLS